MHNILGACVADIQLISNFNKKFRLLVSFIDIYSNYTWVNPLKDKKGITVRNDF